MNYRAYLEKGSYELMQGSQVIDTFEVTGSGTKDFTIKLYRITGKLAKKNLNCKGLRYTDIKDRVKKVAVSSGAGGSNVFDAALAGVDVLVTGEIKHHEIIAANSLGIDIIDAGHFKSEDIVILPLVNKLSKEFSEIIFTKSQSCDDMIKFI